MGEQNGHLKTAKPSRFFSPPPMGGGGGGGCADVDFFRTLPAPKISGIEYVGLVWKSKECVAIWVVYHSPNSPPETLLHLLEAVPD